jgi:uncharacterized protein (DUF952 family)
MHTFILKIMSKAAWRLFCESGTFTGAPVDLADGFIHFSTLEQAADTARKHFAGASDLMLVAVARDRLGAALKDEPSRGGDLFPHLYAPLALEAVLWAKPLPLGKDGLHLFPDGTTMPATRDF